MLVKEAQKLNEVGNIKKLDVGLFLKDKKLQVSDVVEEKNKPYTLIVRILEDDTKYEKGEKLNEGQYFRVSLQEEFSVPDIAEELFSEPLIKLNYDQINGYVYFGKLYVNVRSFEINVNGNSKTIGG